MEQLELDLRRPSLKQILIEKAKQANQEVRDRFLAYLGKGNFGCKTQKGGLKGEP